MGRLIDKDATIKALHEDPIGALIAGMYNVDGWLEKREEVPAIPVDWIEAKMKRLKAMDNGFSCLAADILYGVLIDWRREQDGQTG